MNNSDFQYWQNRQKIADNDRARRELDSTRAAIFDEEINGISSASKLKSSEKALVEAKLKAFGQIIRQSTYFKILEKMGIDSNDTEVQKIYNERVEESIEKFTTFDVRSENHDWVDPMNVPVFWKREDELEELQKDLIHHRDETFKKNRKLVNNTKYGKK